MRRLAGIVLLALCLAPHPGFADPLPAARGEGAKITINDYVAALEAIRAADATAARTQAQQLLGAQIDAPSGRFSADSALLHEVLGNPTAARPHLDATIDALRAAVPRAAGGRVDRRLLERLRAEEAAAAMKAGGEVRTLPADDKALEQTAGVLGKAWRWLSKQIDKLGNVFERWWPQDRIRDPKKPQPLMAPKWIVTTVAIAIVLVLAVLAFEVVRRSRAAGPQELVTSDPVTSQRDEDPLSRGATEWERYAAQLAAAGRTREAIRAWYHAVLVTLYAGGILHFKKGRTNWEYIASLSPEVPWRAQLVALTRHFETEWYGHAESTSEALDEASERARRILDAARRRAAA